MSDFGGYLAIKLASVALPPLRLKLFLCILLSMKHPGSDKKKEQDALEAEWLKIGLPGPARRALVKAKLYKVSDLRKISLAELESLHGMGKSSIARIKVIMNAKKIKFLP
jgi:hypothetical protein